MRTDGEGLWVKTNFAGQPSLYLGAFYRPNQRPEHLDSLSESLATLNNTRHKNILLTGDFNLPYMNWDTPCHVSGQPGAMEHERCLDIFHDSGLENVVKGATHDLGSTLDLLVTNNPTAVNRIEILPPFSDHNPVFTEIALSAKRAKQKPRIVPAYKRASWDRIKAALNAIHQEILEKVRTAASIDSIWTLFRDKLCEAINEHIPTRTIKESMRLPWVTTRLRRLGRRRDRASKRARRNGHDPRLRAPARQLKHDHQRAMRKAYWDFIDNLISIDNEDHLLTDKRPPKQKRLFQYIKSLRNECSGVPSLKQGDRLITDTIGKAEALNDQYQSVFTKEPPGPIPDKGPSPYQTMEDPFITEAGVLKLLQNIKVDKATGPNAIAARVMRETAFDLAPVLTTIFTHSINTESVPEDWKKANVIPIFKKGSKYSPSNYRPVSLTCISCKVMEHIMVSNIMDHFDNHNILFHNQHGFRGKLLCETQLIQLTDDIAHTLDRRKQADLLILDFSKAFDKVPHRTLAHKLDWYGVRNKSLAWITAFLKDRTQRVLLDGETSKPRPVTSGVPQGTVLGPVLFLAYINDLHESITNSNVRLFADDCVLYRDITDRNDTNLLQQDLDALGRWEAKWLMEFNVDKCFVMHATHSKHKIQHQYTLHNQTLTPVKHSKYLGVTLSDDLTWRTHISNVVGDASRTLNFLRRTLRIVSQNTKALAYKALVRPKLEYAPSVWDPHHAKWRNALEAVQSRAARFSTRRCHNTSSVTAMKHDLGWEALADRRQLSRVILFYKIHHNLVLIPIPDYLTLNPRRNRNRHHLCYNIPSVNKDCLKFSFFVRTTRDWNLVPPALMSHTSLNSFRAGARLHFIS